MTHKKSKKPSVTKPGTQRTKIKKSDAEIREEVFNPFSKETFMCKIINVERKGEKATAQAWFRIDSDFTVLLAIEKKSFDEKWKVIGFPIK